jgi:pimeloyl-ACP methyl ester carboxylesterase
VRWLIHDEFDTAKLAQDISTPTLILRASHDTIIPYKYTLSLVKSFQKIVPEVVTIDNTDHNSISVPRIFGETINNFFSN